MTDWERFIELRPCNDAKEWCNGKTMDEAWQTCQRGDWMLWLCGMLADTPMSDGRRRLVLACCQCARLCEQSDVGLRTIQLAEQWGSGDNSISEERLKNADTAAAYAAAAAYVAADAAAYASASAAASAADAAAYAAADAATAVYAVAAADAAVYAAAAVAATYIANASASTASVRECTLADCADIVRQHYPICPLTSTEGN